MAEDKVETGHPLDRQNAIERAIQLDGPKDPDNFKMPDGRTLTEVREANLATQDAEYQEELQMIAARTREQSVAELQKGEKLVMTPTGSIVDVTEPVPSEQTISMATSRTTMAEIQEGAIQPLRETGDAARATGGNAPLTGTLAGSAAPSTASPSSTSPGSSPTASQPAPATQSSPTMPGGSSGSTPSTPGK